MNDIAARFWPKVDRRDSEECWPWLAHRVANGYGIFWSDGSNRVAHRMAWTLSNGPIPEGLTLDHLCRNRGCVNPAHLEPVTNAENHRRGSRATATHCVNGHSYAEHGRRDGRDRRVCRLCDRARVRRYKASKP